MTPCERRAVGLAVVVLVLGLGLVLALVLGLVLALVLVLGQRAAQYLRQAKKVPASLLSQFEHSVINAHISPPPELLPNAREN